MKSHASTLRDFTPALRDFNLNRRVWLISGLAIIVGVGGAGLAVILLRLIAFFTNLFYYHRFSWVMVGPAGSPLGYWMVLVPSSAASSSVSWRVTARTKSAATVFRKPSRPSC
jgi:hypothetical protein